MPLYDYKVKTAAGLVMEGTIDAEEQRAAVEKLRGQKMVVLEIVEQSISSIEKFKAAVGWRKGKPDIPSKVLSLFSRQLSTLVGAGVPIVQSLGILESQSENLAFKEVLGAVKSDIEAGLSISDALKKHPNAFPELYCSMVKAGELGGILDTILERLTAYLESSEELKAKVKGAMMYPAIVLSICSLVTVFLMIFVIPTFKNIFAGFGRALPLPTQILMDISDVMKARWYLIVALPIVAWQAFGRFYATPYGHRWVDAQSLKAPIFGPILKKVAVGATVRSGL